MEYARMYVIAGTARIASNRQLRQNVAVRFFARRTVATTTRSWVERRRQTGQKGARLLFLSTWRTSCHMRRGYDGFDSRAARQNRPDCRCLSPMGCGTTRITDTSRTATEQLLISTAIDGAIDRIDFSPLSGKTAYLDLSYLHDTVDKQFVAGRIRERMIAQGCIVNEKKADATYVVEARAGAIGTDRDEKLIGIPAAGFNMPARWNKGKPSTLSSLALAKSTNQKGVAKIACFAYNRETGQAFWQSGVVPVMVDARQSWFLGVGPFLRGSLYDRTLPAREAPAREAQ